MKTLHDAIFGFHYEVEVLILKLAMIGCSVGTNSVRSSVFGFFGDVRKVRCSVFETELDVRVKVRPNFSEH